ncbi:uncharacterized protein EV422DRAFT_388859 [Fimicolochytrium jonesii]|uniref:uncharacterized protein n=1 Tax=Fimicolochytrium jonesii TaxID=1396493 RepID=UPI0022FEFB84|nr:uncharacterized protein EV422DRAFT_388859 [Fimicolochytrium jonesii]KAI8823028.1 hypothetical protein EV422DRAFT_388859 [Fimicolochytrium jonesii]
MPLPQWSGARPDALSPTSNQTLFAPSSPPSPPLPHAPLPTSLLPSLQLPRPRASPAAEPAFIPGLRSQGNGDASPAAEPSFVSGLNSEGNGEEGRVRGVHEIAEETKGLLDGALKSRVLTPSKVENVFSKITPTRLRQPPLRAPISIENFQPAEESRLNRKDVNSLLEDRPAWDADFHVNRKDFSKPKPGVTLSPGVGGSPTMSRLPQPAGGGARQFGSVSEMRAHIQSPQSAHHKSEVHSPSPLGSSAKREDKAAELSKTCEVLAQKAVDLQKEVSERDQKIRDLVNQLRLEKEKVKQMEEDHATHQEKVLNAWSEEFEKGKALGKELEEVTARYAELATTVVEIESVLHSIKADVDIVEGVLTESQKRALRRLLDGGRDDGEGGDEVDAYSRGDPLGDRSSSIKVEDAADTNSDDCPYRWMREHPSPTEADNRELARRLRLGRDEGKKINDHHAPAEALADEMESSGSLTGKITPFGSTEGHSIGEGFVTQLRDRIAALEVVVREKAAMLGGK